MSSDKYECVRCKNYETERKSNMKNHLNRFRKCKKCHDAIQYTDDEIYELSLIKVVQRTYIKNKCEKCSKIFPTHELLEKHIQKKCEFNNNYNNNNINESYIIN